MYGCLSDVLGICGALTQNRGCYDAIGGTQKLFLSIQRQSHVYVALGYRDSEVDVSPGAGSVLESFPFQP